MCNITTSTQTHNGKTYEYHSVYVAGKRKTFKNKDEAEAFVNAQDAVRASRGKEAAKVFSIYSTAILSAIETLQEAGVDPRKIADAAKQYVARSVKAHGDATLLECAETYLKHVKWDVDSKTYTTASQAVHLFAEQFKKGIKPSEISNTEIISAMDTIGVGRSPSTFNSILRRLKSFASWCDRNDYSVPEDFFDRIQPKHIEAKEPRYIKLDELDRLLSAAKEDREVMALFALQFFAGIRTSEICNLQPEDYHFDDETPFIRVSRAKGASRGRRGRVVHLERRCAQILSDLYPNGETPEINKDTLRKASLCYNEATIYNHHNIGRHSFITYHVALYNDEARTVTTCGTSSDMAAFHYKGLATKSQAKKYFKV